MKKNYIIYLFIALLIASCGKSAKEQELEKVKQELILAKNQLAIKENEEREKAKQIELEKKEEEHKQKTSVGKKKKLSQLNEILEQATNALSLANLELSEINEFEIGRSTATKEYQLRKQREKIRDIKTYIANIKNEISELEYQKTFDFQDNPEDVMKYIFEAAKKEDLSNFQYLCDPYSENDSDVKSICFAEIMLQKGREDIFLNFRSGRIIGEPIINGDKAEVEFAYGRNSDRLEKAKLIKRNNKWFLMSF